MAWTNPTDHPATIVSQAEWNAFHGASGNCRYLKDIADAPMKAQGNGGTVCGGRARLNFISGANVVATVADDGANNRINVTLAASGGTTPTQAESSGYVTYSADNTAKSAYQQLIASTGFAAYYMLISITASYFSYHDIAFGAAGAEVVKLPDFVVASSGTQGGGFALIPFAVPQSTRIAIRSRNVTSAGSVYVGLTILG